jgi:hypothetical protein
MLFFNFCTKNAQSELSPLAFVSWGADKACLHRRTWLTKDGSERERSPVDADASFRHITRRSVGTEADIVSDSISE